MEDIELLKSLEGKTIDYVNIYEASDGDDIGSCDISFTDGTQITIGCTSYNYGSQHLTVN